MHAHTHCDINIYHVEYFIITWSCCSHPNCKYSIWILVLFHIILPRDIFQHTVFLTDEMTLGSVQHYFTWSHDKWSWINYVSPVYVYLPWPGSTLKWCLSIWNTLTETTSCAFSWFCWWQLVLWYFNCRLTSKHRADIPFNNHSHSRKLEYLVAVQTTELLCRPRGLCKLLNVSIYWCWHWGNPHSSPCEHCIDNIVNY